MGERISKDPRFSYNDEEEEEEEEDEEEEELSMDIIDNLINYYSSD